MYAPNASSPRYLPAKKNLSPEIQPAPLLHRLTLPLHLPNYSLIPAQHVLHLHGGVPVLNYLIWHIVEPIIAPGPMLWIRDRHLPPAADILADGLEFVSALVHHVAPEQVDAVSVLGEDVLVVAKFDAGVEVLFADVGVVGPMRCEDGRYWLVLVVVMVENGEG